ncbi:MAG: hypothetical protein HC836_01145 [Richelia sp. RM2_1_2]|nr:hypothetical protein [Richelia sp. SM2_1_7]NJM18666.1 hypothetical protein [Richelia sp. SM1_7_0]NJN06477.1 hypothetical protein [Richelia sp. RM1_1_1]NJO26308.1 hypothetical protein [Richelia sp. SL_2_1]NJO57024.1 hypothetical protein [Richelia sp. RM2_1_2]
MPNYSKNSVILVRYPFSDLSAIKERRSGGKLDVLWGEKSGFYDDCR